jgi:FixJ family two-component response regulator
MEKGAVTFLEKPCPEHALEEALARAFGRAGLPAAEGAAPAAGVAPSGPAHIEYLRRQETLTAREVQIMEAVVAGKVSKVIARELDISSKTVDLHRANVLAKMQASSIVHLTRMAMAQQAL